MHDEEESSSAKDSPRTTAGELQKISGSENLLKNCQTAPTSSHVVWEGFKKTIELHKE